MNARELYIVRSTLSYVMIAGFIFSGIVQNTVGLSLPLFAFVMGVGVVGFVLMIAEWRQRHRERLAAIRLSEVGNT